MAEVGFLGETAGRPRGNGVSSVDVTTLSRFTRQHQEHAMYPCSPRHPPLQFWSLVNERGLERRGHEERLLHAPTK
jgi:hypothetical protein